MRFGVPPLGPDVRQWANDMRRWLAAGWDALTYKDASAKAVSDGVLLWDTAGYPVVSKDGAWVPLVMEDTPLDFGVRLAELEVLSTYGDTVSVIEKAKTLLRFGNNFDIDTADGFATVWQMGSETGTENEVYVASGANTIDSISSTNAADTMSITVEYHVSNGLTGASETFTFGSATVVLNGQTRVALPTGCARVSRMAASGTSRPAGDVFVYENTALTSGKPTDITKAHCVLRGTLGDTQSFKAATTFSNSDYFFMTECNFAVKKGSGAARVDFRVEARQPGGVFRPVTGLYTLSSGSFEERLYPYVIVPKNTDIRVVAATDTNNTEVSAHFQGFLAAVQ